MMYKGVGKYGVMIVWISKVIGERMSHGMSHELRIARVGQR